jgi:hypothetical protein
LNVNIQRLSQYNNESFKHQFRSWYQSLNAHAQNIYIFFLSFFRSFFLHMASSSAINFTLPNIGTGFHSKLEGPNYSAWMTQLVPVLKSHELMGFMDGSEPCPSKFIVDTHGELTSNISPEYIVWSRKDQFMLSLIYATLSKKLLSTVVRLQHARDASC